MKASQVRLPHFSFFEALSQAPDESVIEWRTAKAGLLMLRMLDNWVDQGAEVITDNEWAVDVVHRSITVIDEGHPLRALLMRVLDAVRETPEGSPAETVPHLMAYARGLEFAAQWALAADVYDTVIHRCAQPVLDAQAIVGAQMRLGACLRMLAEWKAAAAAYKVAGNLAESIGDIENSLRSHIATAKLLMDRGNYPKAEGILDRTIARAQQEGLDDVHAAALHDRATVAHHRGRFELAIALGYQALRGTTAQAQRDRVLADLAASFFELGLCDAARDAHTIVAATAEQQYMRWLSAINLVEIAAVCGDEASFEHYRLALAHTSLPVSLAVHYHYYVGQGYRALGRGDLARAALEQAVAIASAHDLNEVLIKAEASLEELRRRCGRSAAAQSSGPRATVARDAWSPPVMNVVSIIHELRTRSGIAG